MCTPTFSADGHIPVPFRRRSASTTSFASLLAAILLTIGTGPVLAHPGSQHRLSLQDERIAEDPDDPAPYLTRARLRGQASHWLAALEDLDRAEGRGGDPLAVALGRIDAYRALQRWDEALAAADQAVALAPERAGPRRSRGLILATLGRRRAAARELSAAFSRLENPSPALVVELAEALEAADRSDEARHHLDAAMHRFGPRSLLLRRSLALELGSRGRAAAEQKLEDLTGGGQALHHRLLWAEVLAEGRHPEVARAVLSQLLLDSESPRNKPRRGIQRLQRRAREALQQLERSGSVTHSRPPRGTR